jgi:hypothetical protein
MSEQNSLVISEEEKKLILENIKNEFKLTAKKRGRKPKAQEDKVWDQPQYKKDYFNKYYHEKIKTKEVQMEDCPECGKSYNHLWKSQHKATKHHLLFIELKNKLLDEIMSKNI